MQRVGWETNLSHHIIVQLQSKSQSFHNKHVYFAKTIFPDVLKSFAISSLNTQPDFIVLIPLAL